MAYLKSQMEHYKDHEMGQEILRACGRLMYDLIPEEQKGKLGKAFNNDTAGIKAALEEAHFNIYKKDYKKALSIMEALVSKVEALNMFQDDQVSEYYVFGEIFEEIL